ncbi:hypothetical protein [Leptospira sanjuanensis]|uniref:hypothetical protein n=1 Tax=Leptospira sanjuanensis TaxID=2879643 RepID=UPI001EE7A7DE|nr:hypothetical protein [Leptospira sanjuanensis]MCG6170213.1 hypothetical protein [Leptospira sanjuanensis]
MKKKITAKEILEIHPESEEAKKLSDTLSNAIVVEKNILRPSNQTFFLGLFFLFIGFYLIKYFPDAIISEGLGGIRAYGLFLTSGAVLMSWFKTGEILKVVGDFIAKIRGAGG